MICYRDMTFCSRSSECANEACFRYVTGSVRFNANEMGLPLALSDMSKTCGEFEEK